MKLGKELCQDGLALCKGFRFEQVDTVEIPNVADDKHRWRDSNNAQHRIGKEALVEDKWDRNNGLMGVDEESLSSPLRAVAEQDPPRASHELRLPQGQEVLSFLHLRAPRG